MEEVTYSYPASGENSVQPHAVSSTSEGGSFSYDANGNMTSRRLETGGTTYTQVWDAENRLKEMAYQGVTRTITITFTYDGNGDLVARETPTDTTVFVGGIYEKNLDTGEVTKYYFFGGQRVAMKKGSTLYYLFGDHLGTTSLVMNSTGTAIIAEARHREASRSVA